MNILVVLEDCDDADAGRLTPAGRPLGARAVAYVHSATDANAGDRLFGTRRGASGREVVTLCGAPDAGRLATALAAAVEGRRTALGRTAAVQHLGVWEGMGATGDAAWRDRVSGQLVSQDVVIPAATLEATARRLLVDCGRLIQQTAADLCTPDWPEGARRAITFTLPEPADPALVGLGAGGGQDELLASLREADGYDGHHGYDDAD